MFEVVIAARLADPRVAKLFVAQLDDDELAVLESALGKVALDCKFG